MEFSGAIAYVGFLGAATGVALVLLFSLRAIKLI